MATNILSVYDGAWIAPSGEVTEVSFMRHYQAAQTILSMLGKAEGSDAETTLCKLGYLHIGLNYINAAFESITEGQIRALFAIRSVCCVSLRNAIDSWVNKNAS